MAQFVMVIQNITSEQFNKVVSIQVKSEDRIKFFPQQTNNNSVSSPGLTSSVQNTNRNGRNVQEQIYTNMRLEWTDDAAEFAREVFDMFIKTDQSEKQKAG